MLAIYLGIVLQGYSIKEFNGIVTNRYFLLGTYYIPPTHPPTHPPTSSTPPTHPPPLPLQASATWTRSKEPWSPTCVTRPYGH